MGALTYYQIISLIAQVDLKLKDENADLGTYVLNGEWHLLGKPRKSRHWYLLSKTQKGRNLYHFRKPQKSENRYLSGVPRKPQKSQIWHLLDKQREGHNW